MPETISGFLPNVAFSLSSSWTSCKTIACRPVSWVLARGRGFWTSLVWNPSSPLISCVTQGRILEDLASHFSSVKDSAYLLESSWEINETMLVQCSAVRPAYSKCKLRLAGKFLVMLLWTHSCSYCLFLKGIVYRKKNIPDGFWTTEYDRPVT